MDQTAALRLAIDLWQVPSRVRAGRASPLPDGISLLLRLANKDDDAGLACAKATGRDPDFLRDAATFYIEQILLAPGADSYRVLGLTPAASPAELRRHMALLLRWLHPDVATGSERSVFAGRITAAWDDLKTPERRAEYDCRLIEAAPRKPARKPGLGRSTKTAFPLIDARENRSSPLTRTIWRLLGRRV